MNQPTLSPCTFISPDTGEVIVMENEVLTPAIAKKIAYYTRYLLDKVLQDDTSYYSPYYNAALWIGMDCKAHGLIV